MRARRLVELSRRDARSGISPRYQKSSDVVKYVLTANTSHIRGLLNCGQMEFVLGYGNSQYANHGRPRCNTGKIAACSTANSVIASAKRLMLVRHFCWKRRRIALISVPAWPMPIHQTKLMIPNAQATGMLLPQVPIPMPM